MFSLRKGWHLFSFCFFFSVPTAKVDASTQASFFPTKGDFDTLVVEFRTLRSALEREREESRDQEQRLSRHIQFLSEKVDRLSDDLVAAVSSRVAENENDGASAHAGKRTSKRGGKRRKVQNKSGSSKDGISTGASSLSRSAQSGEIGNPAGDEIPPPGSVSATAEQRPAEAVPSTSIRI